MELDILSPAWRSDFLLHRGVGEVHAHPDCVSVRTPSQPDFYWGNALVLPEPPDDQALPHWLQRFDTLVTRRAPGVAHVAIGVNRAPPAAPDSLPRWRAAGFELIETVVLQLPRPHWQRPDRVRADVTVRAARLPEEAEALVTLQCASNDGFEPAGYAAHRRVQMARWAQLQAGGWGRWFGLWCQGQLVADCGLLLAPAQGFARFQHVGTHPAWRRQGLCTALVAGVCDAAFALPGVQALWMCAEPGEPAIGIYRSLGFEAFDRVWSLQRRAPRDALQAS